MRNIFKFRFAGVFIVLVTIAVFGAAVMLLWNALLPGLFALPVLSYWQAAGILLLARIIFGGGWRGGFRGHPGQRGIWSNDFLFRHGNELREKWMNMSDEERKEFMEKEAHRRFSSLHDFSRRGERTGNDPEKDNQK